MQFIFISIVLLQQSITLILNLSLVQTYVTVFSVVIEIHFSQHFLLPKMMLKDFNNFVNHLKMKYNALVILISFGSSQELV